MKIFCSCCSSTADLKVIQSKNFPGTRFISCFYCREDGLEPRPLVVLGFLYGDRPQARRHIKYKLYNGPKIEADEIVD